MSFWSWLASNSGVMERACSDSAMRLRYFGRPPTRNVSGPLLLHDALLIVSYVALLPILLLLLLRFSSSSGSVDKRVGWGAWAGAVLPIADALENWSTMRAWDAHSQQLCSPFPCSWLEVDLHGAVQRGVDHQDRSARRTRISWRLLHRCGASEDVACVNLTELACATIRILDGGASSIRSRSKCPFPVFSEGEAPLAVGSPTRTPELVGARSSLLG